MFHLFSAVKRLLDSSAQEGGDKKCNSTNFRGARMSLQTMYAILKGTTIVLGALSIPWSTFIGFSFGAGRYFIGLVALSLQTVVALVDGYIWFWVLENMMTRIQGRVARSTW